LTDKWADPPEEEGQYHSEKMVYLPDAFLCFQAACNLQDIAPGSFNKKNIRFGSFF